MFDEIADVVDVTVKCEDDSEHQVKMLAEWRIASTVWMELTDASLKLFNSTPHASHLVTAFIPCITQPGVRWWPARHCVHCKYADPSTNKTRFRFQPVPRYRGARDIQAATDEAAEKLQNAVPEMRAKGEAKDIDASP